MPMADLGDIRLHYVLEGPEAGLPVVFSNGLGTDMQIWEPLLPHLPPEWRILRYDRRGHGRSDVTPAPYTMGVLVRDTERLLDHLGIGPCVFVGLSLGGMVAQGLAVKRPDLIRALVLSNTAARIATAEIWEGRARMARAGGLAALADASLARWFSPKFRASPAIVRWREMFVAAPLEGWLGGAAAIAGTDFYTTTANLRLPVLGIAGDRDGSTPPDLVRETVELVPGADFALLRGAGHLPQIEQPEAYAAALTGFLQGKGIWPPRAGSCGHDSCGPVCGGA